MNMLGVIFDSKLNLNEHVAMAVIKAKKVLNSIKLIGKFFSTTE
jgi:hypothetical protein